MEKLQQLYEGKAKRIYATTEPDLFWVEYKDDATAFNGEKKGSIASKGELNNKISSIFFTLLKENGVDNHFVEKISEHEQIVKKVTIIPIEVVVRNLTAGSMAKRLGIEEGIQLQRPITEFYYKDDALGDPLIIEDHIYMLNIATPGQVQKLREISLKVNEILSKFLSQTNTILVDFKLEFGVTPGGEVILADEISPDTCRFWDATTKQKLDKDRFRRDLGGVEEAYREILQRLGGK
jgi:phosphoribosylaminoimidazole-succinocarboxamide synthase